MASTEMPVATNRRMEETFSMLRLHPQKRLLQLLRLVRIVGLILCFLQESLPTTGSSIYAQASQGHSHLPSPPINMGQMQRPRRRGYGLSNQAPRSHWCTDTAFCEDKFGGGEGWRYSPGQIEERGTVFGRVHEHSKERG